MIVTYKELHKVNFPVFPLRSSDWHIHDGVVFLEGKVVDERNMPGKTIGIRRLQCGRRDLYPLKKAVLDIQGLLRIRRPAFVDDKGKLFSYLKTYSSKLSCYRIKEIEKKEVASLLWLYGCVEPITIKRPPPPEVVWARILHIGNSPWLLYDYVRVPTKDTYRRV